MTTGIRIDLVLDLFNILKLLIDVGMVAPVFLMKLIRTVSFMRLRGASYCAALLLASVACADNGCAAYEEDSLDCITQGAGRWVEAPIDWEKVQTLAELETCIFAAAVAFSSSDDLIAWLEFNGFDAIAPRRIPPHTMRLLFQRDNSGWAISVGQKQEDFKFRLSVMERIGYIHSVSIGIILTKNYVPLKIKSTFTRK